MIAKFTPALWDNTIFPLQKAFFDFHTIIGFYRRRIVGLRRLKIWGLCGLVAPLATIDREACLPALFQDILSGLFAAAYLNDQRTRCIELQR